MAEVFTKSRRSQVMSAIRGRGNKGTELAMIAMFRRQGITGWRRHQPVFGKPDFIFRRERLAVFVDGCFWHNCPKHSNTPVNNRDFWVAKLGANRRRDALVGRTLRAKGWRVLRVWEHELTRRNEVRLTGRIRRAIDAQRDDSRDGR
jgi:DNA mismatch endonuclease, patch repair protein